MCVLTGKEIEVRATNIFKEKTWTRESCQEASYDLRVSTEPYLRIGGKLYEPENPFKKSHIVIEPGELAMIPTVESFNMPCDLVGDIKIKFRFSRKGLTSLIAPKVDPFYGREHSNGERLYLWVTNLGLEPIHIQKGKPVFNVQFHRLVGETPSFHKKPSMGRTIAEEIHPMATTPHLGFMDKIKAEVRDELKSGPINELDSRLKGVEQGTTQVVQFGVFLVASALLAGFITALFAMVFALNTRSGVAMTANLENSSLGILLLVVCVILAVVLIVFLWETFLRFIRRR